ncbi:galactose-binding like protein [Didymella exigua CBS 183.55]|uniref:Galactose-binding like protein n=1 Tax=Didymella exigua CBS 183.55 TaxID=1150837 RepID=A0A6A5RJ85_9PLEO|nr:galactose-binding like protein [Didymella exigua CBS 183.55]KAF1927168.1 galactose-binding like protein [Didymella exigua CBS 183.55]
MPQATRRRAPHHMPPPPAEFSDSDQDFDEEEMEPEEDLGDDMVAMEGEEDMEEEEALASAETLPNLEPPPSYLREISTLASWTVSSSKPGCSIPQLRHPSPNFFWQSDGPQPHYLNIHFFKLVRIVGLRLYLDFEQDESYTPTRIIFLAGSGMNDLQEWGEMRLESPRGWQWANFANVGDADSDSDASEPDSEDDAFDAHTLDLNRPRNRRASEHRSSDSENMPLPPQRQRVPSNFPNLEPTFDTPAADAVPAPPQHRLTFTPQFNPQHQTPVLPRPAPRLPFSSLSPNTAPRPRQRERRPKMPVLRAHLVQIKILENHQNGKDTHLRGLQIFAKNDEGGEPVKGRVSASDARRVDLGEVGTTRTGRRGKEEVLELGGLGGFDIR